MEKIELISKLEELLKGCIPGFIYLIPQTNEYSNEITKVSILINGCETVIVDIEGDSNMQIVKDVLNKIWRLR